MEQKPNTRIILIGIGSLLFIAGALFSYILYPHEKTVVVTEPVIIEQQNEYNYAWHAPEEYEQTVRLYQNSISLPEPKTIGDLSVESAIFARRSFRDFKDSPLSLEEVSQMLWAGMGVTSEDGRRSAPSAGGGKPVSLFIVVSMVEDLEPGLYEYLEESHALGLVREGEFSEEWAKITTQPHPKNAPAVILLTGDMYHRYHIYGEATERLLLQESGHIAQNLYLQAESLGLGMTVMGGFDPSAGQEFVGTKENEPVVYLVPFGKKE